MENKTSRRSFLKVSSISGGGMLLGFSWLASLKPTEVMGAATGAKDWVELTGFIKILPDNQIKILSPNPEFGQNVMTSLPMLIAEELEVDWKKITVEMGDYDTPRFKSQFTGGSQSIRSAWGPLRKAGATAKWMLLQAAANQWNVPVAELTASNGTVIHKASNRTSTYGALAEAASKLPVPSNPVLKKSSEHNLVGKPQKNVEGPKIVAGKSLFTMDYQVEGMLIAMAIHPPAFGMQLKSFDATEAKKMPGIKDVFDIEVYKKGYERAGFDTRTFNHLIVVVGNSTWEVINARKKVVAQWEPIVETKEMVTNFGRRKEETIIPAGLESSDKHMQKMLELQGQKARVLRKDGDPEAAFATAKKVIEKTYSAPFLPHNTMEPISCFAHITDEKAFFVAPIQIPDMMKQNIVANLDVPADKIEMKLARMGGGFGRRAYGHYIIEAGLISKKMKAPVKLIYTREDDMTNGVYRPAYIVTYKAALDANNNIIAIHIKGGGIPEHAVHENRFPAGAFDNYLAEGWELPSNITIGAFRAPRSNFIASAEQSFLDELAHAIGKDPIDFRIELLKKAKSSPVGKNNEYDAARYIGVLELVKEKSKWTATPKGTHRGVAAYFCHNSYAAHVVDVSMKSGQPVIEQVVSVLDCGIVVNPDAAKNMVEGAVVDGIGNSLFGGLKFDKGVVTQQNLNQYRMIRMKEAPKKIDVHFVQNNIDPTGLGEPPFPPIFAALANALYKATGKRFYHQPFINELNKKA
ncbi:MAG: isoquinoline 1-oxidoreductase [Chitinophagaceae bacterium BSSC1]|nr:MAG: isoquinoline 1-oxidoreductase [Chitinophagaceae bacterium BSSC1]